MHHPWAKSWCPWHPKKACNFHTSFQKGSPEYFLFRYDRLPHDLLHTFPLRITLESIMLQPLTQMSAEWLKKNTTSWAVNGLGMPYGHKWIQMFETQLGLCCLLQETPIHPPQRTERVSKGWLGEDNCVENSSRAWQVAAILRPSDLEMCWTFLMTRKNNYE